MSHPVKIMIKRRNLLLAGSAAFAMSALGSQMVLADGETKSVVLCFTDVGVDTPPDMVFKIIQAFVSLKIPVSCAVKFGAVSGGTMSPLMQVIKEIGDREPGLFEVLAVLPELEHGQRYFQMRNAEKLRRSIVGNLFPETRRSARFPCISIFDQFGNEELDFPAFRSAGFRTLVRLQANADSTQIMSVGRGQLEIKGGIALDLAQAAPPTSEEIETLLANAEPQLVTVSLALQSGADPSLLIERCTHLARIIDSKTSTGLLFASRPTDLLLHLTEQPAPIASVLLRPPATTATDDSMRVFAQGLAEKGIPFTTMVDEMGFTGPETAAFCSVYSEGADTKQVFDCSFLPDKTQLSKDHPSSVIILPQDTGDSWTGIQRDGRYRISAIGAPDMTASELMPVGSNTDEALVIYPENVETFLQRARLINQLASRQNSGRLKLESINGFAKHLVADDPVFDRFHAVRKLMNSEPRQAVEMALAERESLLDDARLAWLYIDKYTHSETGLCAGTVRGGPNRLVHQQATMWDIASQLQGIVAAFKLDLINQSEAQERAGKMLGHLPTATIEGLRLPPAFFSTSSSRSTKEGFDFCDTARFFTALSAAQNAGLVTIERGQEVFSLWDVEKVVRDGHPFNFKRGQWVNSFMSHCAPYSSRGLAPWGIALLSPYPEIGDEESAADRMRLLYSVAKIGHYGTEPILLEAIELGASKASNYLAEVLFDAQLSYYERTGLLKCASETLLDFEPWFSYQGIRLDEIEEDGWVVASPDPDREFQTEAFQRKSEVISSKSAYLWAATYPHAYSQRLVDFIREKARVEGLGFAAGVYTQTEEVMAYYCDINTNGIILSAISHMINPPE